MKPEDLVNQANRMISNAVNSKHLGALSVLAEAKEFLRVYAGEKSSFYKQINQIDAIKMVDSGVKSSVCHILDAFVRYIKNGLLEGMSIQRQAQIDVVSDILSQATNLLASNDVHPAAPTVLIGASLEEFLRNWIEEADINLGTKKPSIEAFANALREVELITKQDSKDITSWGGLRNHAAHGEWDEVQDRQRINLMLEGVNLFMRKYGKLSA